MVIQKSQPQNVGSQTVVHIQCLMSCATATSTNNTFNKLLFLNRWRAFGMERTLSGGQDLRRGPRRDSRLKARTPGRVEGFKGLTHTHGPSSGHGPAHARPGSLLEPSVLARWSCTAWPAGRAVNCCRAGGQRQARSHDQWPAWRNPHAQSQLSQLRCSSVPRNENTGRTKFFHLFCLRANFNFKLKVFFWWTSQSTFTCWNTVGGFEILTLSRRRFASAARRLIASHLLDNKLI